MKVKAVLKNIINKTKKLFEIVKCNVCDKDFVKVLPWTFRSDPKKGALIYFCPTCNKNLACSCCEKKLGATGFELYSLCGEKGHRNVIIICADCKKAGVKVPVCNCHTK